MNNKVSIGLTDEEFYLKYDRQKCFAITTLGCKVNQYESDAIINQFKANGYLLSDFSSSADVYIINTCTVTHISDRKSRQAIRRAIHNNPQAIVVVTGCYAQISPRTVSAIEGVDLVIGNDDKNQIVQLAEDFSKEIIADNYQPDNDITCSTAPLVRVSDIMMIKQYRESDIKGHEGKTRAFLKIQEGCNNFCSYCIVPYARGPLRSRQPENVLREAKKLLYCGYQEIVLTGIHTGAYGTDLSDCSLEKLLEMLLDINGMMRLRLSSIDPHEVTSGIIELMATRKNFCSHFHIPLQSGNNKIIKLMNRHYDTEQYTELINKIVSQIPEVALTTDVIVGFPGESDEDFAISYNYINNIPFSKLHVFKYSPRKGTPAAKFAGQVSDMDKDSRSRRLIELGEKKQADYASRFVGKTLTILIEQPIKQRLGWYEGLSDNYIRVEVYSQHNISGCTVQAKIISRQGQDLIGEIVC